MGAAISSSLAMGVTWCCCTAVGSLCQSCFGSTRSSGRKRAVLLLTVATALALYFQYSLGPSMVDKNSSKNQSWMWSLLTWMPGVHSVLEHAWYDSCAQYDSEDYPTDNLLKQCAGNAGVYRPMAVAFWFFVGKSVATYVSPQLNAEVWPAKYAIYFFLVAFSVFLHNDPWFSSIFLWIARFGAAIFLILQQVILIDCAYDWNEDWIDRADQEDRLSYGSGSSWLHAIVGTCAAFYLMAVTGIGLLYAYFAGDCAENTWIITLTLLGIIAFTAIQLTGTDGSLLTSSIMSLYVVYLAYSMVSKNPNGTCNPHLGQNDVFGITMGLTLTAISLAWTGWSWTAEERLNVDNVQVARAVTTPQQATSSTGVNLDQPFLDPEDRPATGLVTETDESLTSSVGGGVWKLNVVMALIACFVAMLLTGWGTITIIPEEETNAANPTIGRVNMAMIGISQWTAILLYIWTLLAPRLFPDRDFN